MRNLFPATLSLYLARKYLMNFIIILFALLAVIYLFDAVELLRRAGKFDDIPLRLVLIMALYKLPEVGQAVFPFAVLFSGMLTFWQLTRRHELTIVRSSGLSVWQFIMPIVATALLIGMVKVMLINPVGALFIEKYKTLETEYLERNGNRINLSVQGLWLRQSHEKGMAILHSEKINIADWTLENVMVFFFTDDNNFLRRIDAKNAKLDQGQWTFKQVVSNQPQQPPEKSDLLSMATDLTAGELKESFAAPETISFWKLPGYIKILDQTGIDSTSLRIYYQNLLAEPLLFMAMILLAASVSLRPPRLRGASTLIMGGVMIGFVVFFASSFLQALGASQQIPIMVSAWFPAIICFLLGIGALMVLEDG
jgi:lipopolysaccharide export system permease protein